MLIGLVQIGPVLIFLALTFLVLIFLVEIGPMPAAAAPIDSTWTPIARVLAAPAATCPVAVSPVAAAPAAIGLINLAASLVNPEDSSAVLAVTSPVQVVLAAHLRVPISLGLTRRA